MIFFHDDVNKAMDGAARAELLNFLDKTEPQLVQWLHHTWNAQGKAITYKELREMILNGDITPELIEEWQQDYSRFVVTYLAPLYVRAMEEATERLSRKYPLFAFDPASEGVKQWTDNMGAAFVTNSTTEQIKAVRWVVARAAQMQDMGVDELARVIRPMVGLNRPQTIANLNYYNRLIQQGVSQAKAQELAIKYSARQHRYRGHMIARTELAFAFNKGQHLGVAQAINKGWMSPSTVKIWETAGDDRVCETCKELERQSKRNPVPFNAGFNVQSRLTMQVPGIDETPPAHPHCRCAVAYKELTPPTFSTTQ